MIVVGLTGGVATGKSTVAAMFEARGAAVVDADRIARGLQEPGQPCYRQIVETFGREVVGADGRLDRRRLARLVFDDAESRRRLEAIMHPAIWDGCQAGIRAAEAAGRPLCVVDAALILEAGWQHRFQAVIVVTAPEAMQVDRQVRMRSLTHAEAHRRLRTQWPTAAKAALADFVIDNGGDLAATAAQVERIFVALTRNPAGRQKALDKDCGSF